jgi:hypothetical protein
MKRQLFLLSALSLADLSSAQLNVFAVTSEVACAESLAFGPCATPLTEASDAFVCTNFRDEIHEAFFQEFYVNDVLQFTIDWNFQSGPKTLRDRFVNAVAVGEEVRWVVRVPAILGSPFGIDYEEHHAIWRFSKDSNVDSAFVNLVGSGFSGDDGSWGAAFTDGSTHVDGSGGGSISGGWGHENYNNGDLFQCKKWYANGIENECLSGDTIRSVMSLGSNQGTCFHGATKVTLEDETTKAMTELQVGDKIKTSDANGNFQFSPVLSLPHKAGNSEMAKFLKLTTESGKNVRMTPGHLLPNCAGKTVSAAEVGIGDCVKTIHGKESITEITSATHFGVYTAVTADAFIVADGFVASSFSTENDPGRHQETGASAFLLAVLERLSGKPYSGLGHLRGAAPSVVPANRDREAACGAVCIWAGAN